LRCSTSACFSPEVTTAVVYTVSDFVNQDRVAHVPAFLF
jgi:hypothetical protein